MCKALLCAFVACLEAPTSGRVRQRIPGRRFSEQNPQGTIPLSAAHGPGPASGLGCGPWLDSGMGRAAGAAGAGAGGPDTSYQGNS